MTYLKIFTLSLLLCSTPLIYAQSKRVEGKITDTQNNPMIGATVQIKNTNTGVVTDAQGNFSMEVPSSAQYIIVSYIDYTTQELLITEEPMNIVMTENIQTIEDVVVMGYNSQKRSSLTGSVVTLASDKLQDVTSSNIANSLQGKIAGVQINSATGAPGSTPEIMIRGAGSITAQATPLYVVDGIAGGSYNPNDVETLTVLKDAAATSLYGSAAAGGVIIVTTKRGNLQQPTAVAFKGVVGGKLINNNNFQLMNGEQLYNFHKLAMNPEIFAVQRPAALKKQNFDWLNAAFQTGLVQNYNLSVSGGSNKVAYRISADWYDEIGTLINTDYKRLNIRGNLNFVLHEKVRLVTNISFTNNSDKSYAWYTLEDAYKNMPWDNPYDKDGNTIFINSNRRPDGKVWYGNRKMNFLQSEEYNFDRYSGNDLVADATLTWQIIDMLSFETRNRGSVGGGKSGSFRDPRTFDPEWASRGMIYETTTNNMSIGNTNLLRFKKEFSDHLIDAFAGVEFGYWKNSALGVRGLDLPAVGLASLSVAANYQDGMSNIIEGSSMSVLGQIQYGYKERYLASISFRTDASSAFGPENRWGAFPAGSLAWVISQESFLKNNPYLTFLKIRGSFGVTGNSNIGQYRYLSNYTLSAQYDGRIGAVPVQLGNPALGWESAYMANLGIDFALVKRVNVSLDLYNTDNRDLLLNVPLPPSGGFEVQLRNAGSVRNQGIELQISSLNIDGDFKWTTDFNIGANRNRMLSTPGGTPFSTSVSGSTTLSQIIEEGTDIFTWYMPNWAGVDPQTGSPQWWRTKDEAGNEINPELTTDYALANPQKVGSANPVFTGGFNNSFSYFGFTLNINCNFVYGNKIYNLQRESFDSDGRITDQNQMVLAKGWNRWTKPGDIATHPKPIAGGNNNAEKTSSRYLEDGSYFKIRNIMLAYDFPKNLLAKFKCTGLRLYVSVDNPFTFTKYSGMDPEVSFQRGEYVLPGLQSFKYPISRQFLGGLEITF